MSGKSGTGGDGRSKGVSKEKRSPVATCATLCAESLWKQSLQAGKGPELMALLQVHSEGQRLLKKAAPKPLRVLTVCMGGEDSMMDNTYGMVPWSRLPLWLTILIDQYENGSHWPGPRKRSMLGGLELGWCGSDEFGDWATNLMPRCNYHELERFLEALGVMPDLDDLEDDDDEGGTCTEIAKLDRWVSENPDDVTDAIIAKAVAFFELLPAEGMILSAQEVEDYNDDGVYTLSGDTFIIDKSNGGW